MDLECFLYPGWKPRIRPAQSRRDWMDAAPESFAYRCLPLAIANAHGWEIGSSVGFRARWTGGAGVDAVEVLLDDPKLEAVDAPVSLFGNGVLTFHVAGLFRTAPGWNLWLSGPPNAVKDGIAPLSGVIETDWSPYSFTMNWRFTRPDHWVRFAPDEAFAFFFPVERGAIETVRPSARDIEEAPALKQQFEDWSRSRDAFQALMRDHPPTKPSDKWQKLYYRGVCPAGAAGAADHQTKLHVRKFAGLPAWDESMAPSPQGSLEIPRASASDQQLQRRNWLLGVQEGLRALSPRSAHLHRFEHIDPDYFLDHHYAANRPVILGGEMTGWPALERWSPDALARRLGDTPIEVQGGRNGEHRFELDKARRRQTLPFSRFIEQITRPGAGNDTYLTAYNSTANKASLSPLHADLGRIDSLLAHGPDADEAMLWIGAAGTFTPLHHDLTNNLLAQIVGRKQVILVPPSETPRLRNVEHVFSQIGDLLDPKTLEAHPDLRTLRLFSVLLEPGDALFIPIGWWHQVTSRDFSISATYTNFRWRNDWADGFS